jgi:hypothetical protein
MLNRAPIFVNGFQRGGTNILINLIASHRDIGLLSVETHQVFWGKPSENVMKWVHRFFYFPVMAVEKDRERHWFTLEQLSDCFRKDVNENQIAFLSEEDRSAFLQEADKSMRFLGYN